MLDGNKCVEFDRFSSVERGCSAKASVHIGHKPYNGKASTADESFKLATATTLEVARIGCLDPIRATSNPERPVEPSSRT